MSLKIRAVILAAAALVSLAGWQGLKAIAKPASVPSVQHVLGERPVPIKIHKSDKEWRALLAPLQYRVLREKVTEPAFSGALNNHYEKGIYVCAACGTPLFSSEAKYDSGSGWPSFLVPLDETKLEFLKDTSFLMDRIEVRCAVCGSHLGHLFDDGPGPTFEHYCINSAAMNFRSSAQDEKTDDKAAGPPSANPKATTSPQEERATFAAGCFWGVEYKFSRLKGVLSTRVGYAGGTTVDPTYAQVCSDRTGHAEAVEVRFDPTQTNYEELVRFFFSIHDPTEVDRQGPDVGTQYRSVVFYQGQNQKMIAEKVLNELRASGRYDKPIATGLVPAGTFYPAEAYHQKYYEKNRKDACAY
jgi:peptide methionine sulfoxide reductase msrA/msrB